MALWWVVALAWAGAPEDAVVAAFSPRHAAPACEAVAAGFAPAERLAAFVAVAEGVEVPPWVPLAAAGCVAEQGEDPLARAAVERWITGSDTSGLAYAALGRLDALPPDVAAPIASLAVTRAETDPRFATYALPTLARSRHEAVRTAARP